MTVQLLVQLPDEDALTRVDAKTLREVAQEPGHFVFVIRDGAVTRWTPPARSGRS